MCLWKIILHRWEIKWLNWDFCMKSTPYNIYSSCSVQVSSHLVINDNDATQHHLCTLNQQANVKFWASSLNWDFLSPYFQNSVVFTLLTDTFLYIDRFLVILALQSIFFSSSLCCAHLCLIFFHTFSVRSPTVKAHICAWGTCSRICSAPTSQNHQSVQRPCCCLDMI